MRHFTLFATLLSSAAVMGPAFADQIVAASHITAVTVYPYGAQVTRVVDFDAAVGAHDVLIPDLPAQTPAELIRLQAEGVTLGAFSLRTDRLPPRDETKDPAMLAAKAAVAAAETDVRSAQAGVDAINAAVEAAEAQVDFLRRLRPEGDAVTVEGVKALAGMVGVEVLTARKEALAAQTQLPAAQKVLEDARKLLGDAQAGQDALSQRAADYAGLSVAITADAAGPVHLVVQHYVESASWQPVYDMMLTRKDPSLTIVRGVLVSQTSGEDWAGVDLTLSTAQPSEQAEPSVLWPDLKRVIDPVEMAKRAAAGDENAQEMLYSGGMSEPVMEPEVVAAPMIKGDVVVYHYPAAVDVATGVENLRLALDEIKLVPQIEAWAVPRRDDTAFVMAKFVNDSGEILLPGQAYLLREGELVGATQFSTVAAGAEAKLAFGAIEGLRLKRDMPLRAEGDRGILSSSTQVEEKAVLQVENLTAEAWPVRLFDQVPYSEQEDLEISYTADPAPSEVDVDGQRGILAWTFDLAAGEKKSVQLDHVLRWPEGKQLQ
ncbi:hypothetical protein GCM10010873_09470 [Cypionkella aquatica]|uniref:DUF4139 domain-containing protein n=1 Tax=Cypionkella aquatica TaxID=1756042 RepID=A0AA37TUU5_9RHOB|nr:DUF4139 domain-containing protein [Cypionkella aquatica]GLS85973.1 hypothetical protein GCM10010873_09470 [Cypionkella aquatica]